jgi:hypothetical protein
MTEIEPFFEDFVTDRAERLCHTLNKLHYLEDSRDKGLAFGAKTKVGKKETFTPFDLPAFIQGVQTCIVSLRDDLVAEGKKDLADELIAYDKKQREVPIPEAFKYE